MIFFKYFVVNYIFCAFLLHVLCFFLVFLDGLFGLGLFLMYHSSCLFLLLFRFRFALHVDGVESGFAGLNLPAL